MSENLTELETKIGHSFKDKTILKEAITHGSVRSLKRELPHHERLEFLGDSILNLVISEYFFKRESSANPGELTIQRMALVTDAKQGQIAKELGIWKYVEFGHGVEPKIFKRWGEFVEALIGAVYVDAGMGHGDGLQKAKQVIFKLWKLTEPAQPPCVVM